LALVLVAAAALAHSTPRAMVIDRRALSVASATGLESLAALAEESSARGGDEAKAESTSAADATFPQAGVPLPLSPAHWLADVFTSARARASPPSSRAPRPPLVIRARRVSRCDE